MAHCVNATDSNKPEWVIPKWALFQLCWTMYSVWSEISPSVLFFTSRFRFFVGGSSILTQLTDNQIKTFILSNAATGKFSCGICRKEMTRRVKVFHHIKAVHVKKKDSMCPYCPKAFSNSNQLRTHISRKHEEEHRINKLIKKSV